MNIAYSPLLCVLAAALSSTACAATHSVSVVVPDRMAVHSPMGSGQATLETSEPLKGVHPHITRVLIIVHGHLRNADTYFDTGEHAIAAAHHKTDTLLIAPQFLNTTDVQYHQLASDTLAWSGDQWMGGLPAAAPAPISSFEVLDALLRTLADKQQFPNLRDIVIAGHSGGAQVVQRYAILQKTQDILNAAGIKRTFVVANPSSYAYFNAKRPVVLKHCADVDMWKYGMHELPPYAGAQNTATLASRYTQQDITYLLGANDTNPNHPALDKSCAAEAQGAYRLARGRNYFQQLSANYPDVTQHQRLVTVPGVGHNGDKMFTSPEGQQVLFGK